MKKLITTMTMILSFGAAIAATFEDVRFDTPVLEGNDPLGIVTATNAEAKAISAGAAAQEAATAASNAQTTADGAMTQAQTATTKADAADAKATTATNDIATVQTQMTMLTTSVEEFKDTMTNAVTSSSDGTVVVGSMKGTAEDVGMLSKNNAIVFGVNRDSDELAPEEGQILMSADKIKFDSTLGNIYFGDSSLQALLAQSGQGEINTIVTVKTNGVALVPDSNRAIDIVFPEPKEISLDGKLDATNGVAYGDLKVYPMPSGIVGQTHTIITHESMSIGDAEYKEDGMTYNGETYEFSSDTNGLARLKDIPTISTNGVSVAPDASKNVNIVIPAPGEGNVIETIKTNGVALAVSEKAVDIAIPDVSGFATKQELNDKTFTTSAITDLDSYKNPTISAAALTAIDGIANAQDIATIKSTLTNFLNQFVISAP